MKTTKKTKRAIRRFNAEDIMTVEEATEFLGIWRSAVYKRIHLGKIPYTRLGKRYILFRKDVVEWKKKRAETERNKAREPEPAIISEDQSK